jgi:hypothetical protein
MQEDGWLLEKLSQEPLLSECSASVTHRNSDDPLSLAAYTIQHISEHMKTNGARSYFTLMSFW